MATPQPAIGDWYRLSGGALFEVVALEIRYGFVLLADSVDVNALAQAGA